MPYINSTDFGSITIDNKKYNQVLIIGNDVKEREYSKLVDIHNTSHVVGEWELVELLSNKPEVIVIGNGQSGVLTVEDKVKDEIEKAGVVLIIDLTPGAVITYNVLVKDGKRVNALIHTTC